MNLHEEEAEGGSEEDESFPFYGTFTSYLDELFIGDGVNADDMAADCAAVEDGDANNNGHEYVRCDFSEEVLQAMKSYGMIHSAQSFVSTNDMITAVGWYLMKRRIAQKPDWNLAMVVNLRSRGGIHDFDCVKSPTVGLGVLGNCLTSVVAKLPPSSTNNDVTMTDICHAATSIRESLTKKMGEVNDLQTLSLSGRPAQVPNQGNCFSSTSWMQFPLWDIRFSNHDDGSADSASGDGQYSSGSLDGFYGRLSHPLPLGDTYSSINVPSRSGGCTYKLLAPTRQVQSIRLLHKDISLQFLDWAREHRLLSKEKESDS